MPLALLRILLLCIMLAPAMAGAADYFSIAANGTVLFDAPSAKANKLFVVSQLYPVEAVVSLGDWIKVRDVSGALAWVEKKQLSEKRTVLVTAPRADVRQSADDAAALVFQAEKGVALDYLESLPGWVKVRHRDGQVGYVKLNQVWGA